jgi:hypothetical protein
MKALKWESNLANLIATHLFLNYDEARFSGMPEVQLLTGKGT